MKNRVSWFTVVVLLAFGPTTTFADNNEQTKQLSFFADRRAHQKGDVLTVLIAEVASVTAQARTRTSKSESALARFRQLDEESQQLTAGFDREFSGGGQIQRSGRLLATLAVTISGFDENDNLIITGEQVILLNNERQIIRLDGVVRLEDISPDNTISSTRVSNARIELKGHGVLARRQAPGLFSRILALFGG